MVTLIQIHGNNNNDGWPIIQQIQAIKSYLKVIEIEHCLNSFLYNFLTNEGNMH